MKLGKFIEMLKEYPMDAEIQLYDKYGYDKNIFKIGKLAYDNKILLSPLQSCLEEIGADDEEYEKVSYNVDDTFNTYSYTSDNTVSGTVDDFKVMIKAEDVEYSDEVSYKDDSFSHVGGLVKFLSSFPDDMPVNLKCCESHSGVIHEITKMTIEYFTGVDPRDGDVISDFSDELFLEFGVPVSGWDGGGTFPLRDNYPWYSSGEVEKVIAEPLRDYFKEHNIHLSEDEANKWSDIVRAIKDNLYKYYSLTYRLNGSWDSNGYFHPFDKDELYIKPKFEEEIRE